MLAFKHVHKLKGFYIHLTQYLIIIPALFALNIWQDIGHNWAIYPALGWGLGVLMQSLIDSGHAGQLVDRFSRNC